MDAEVRMATYYRSGVDEVEEDAIVAREGPHCRIGVHCMSETTVCADVLCTWRVCRIEMSV